MKQILKYLNSSKDQLTENFLNFLQQFKNCEILISVRRFSYYNQLLQDTILLKDLYKYIILGDKTDSIYIANLATQKDIENYFFEISRYSRWFYLMINILATKNLFVTNQISFNIFTFYLSPDEFRDKKKKIYFISFCLL